MALARGLAPASSFERPARATAWTQAERRETYTVGLYVYRLSDNREEVAMPNMDPHAALESLPDTFRYSQAHPLLNDRQMRSLLADNAIERLARGLYRKTDADGDEDLAAIAAKSPRATLCLRTALARHDLLDDIPFSFDIALPRNTWPPATPTPVTWHYFDPRTFELGRDLLRLGEHASIGLYSPTRCIIDAYRIPAEGPELGNEVLRRWLRAGGQPSTLLTMAKSFPRTLPAIRNALTILL